MPELPVSIENNPAASNFSDTDRPTWELYSTCIHCGLCLNHCPTYRVLGTEMDSPRGRIYQVMQVDQGRMEIGDAFVTHIDRCLDCRACETACPSGVQYGRIVERARAQIEQHYRRPFVSRVLRNYFLNSVLPDFNLLSRWARLLRFYQRSGVQAALRRSGLLALLRVKDLDALTPVIEPEFYFEELGKVYPAAGQRRGRVLFHAGCIAQVAFASLNRATVRVLVKNGVEVVIPQGQGCCGALQAHAGYREQARRLAERNIRAMTVHDGIKAELTENGGFDAIVTNAAGCGSTLKEYADLFQDGIHANGRDHQEWLPRAKEFDGKVRDVTEYLAALGIRPPMRKFMQRVTYQDPCHLAHGQRIRSAPRQLLEALGVNLVEMHNSDHCCGSAGIYNVVQNELSMKILDARMEDVAQTAAEVVATANVGCMLQLRAGCKRSGIKADVLHVIELMDACY